MGGKIQWKKEDHPVEVIGRLRQNSLNNGILIQLADNKGIRIKSESGQHMDFSLDGISWSEEALQTFYDKYIKTRVEGVKSGGKCTIVMYGATGSGKSYTMFGDMKEGGIAYRALHHIMDEGDEIVKVSVLEIYNEEVCDLLARSSAKGGASPKRVRLDVRGGKVKNSCLISGKKADDIVRDIQLVEKKRVVKSTNCNERSSRSHCIITVDVPSVRGQLVLVDMAGSENIDQGAIGIEAKMQTGKINQGNGALKRVVEAIANGDNYIPYRDSKLTMLLQDSFEDEKAKILMILCASTDPKDIYKTIGTLEYGSKAKCIVKLPKSPVKDKIKATDQVVLQNRINVMLDLIERLQAENQLKDEFREKIEKELIIKNQQVENLKSRVANIEGEKYQFLEYVEKAHEKLLKLIYTIEINTQIITKKEIKLYKNMQEHQAKISEFINMVQSIEDKIICKISEHQHQKALPVNSNMAQNSYSLMVNSGTIPNCLTTDATGIGIPPISRNESTLEGASNELQVQVDSAMSKDPNNAYNVGSQILSCSGFKQMINLSTSYTEDSCPDTRPEEDQKTSKKIRHKKDNTKKHSLRDWDEEVQFTVVCNDSEHQAVICRSCDQIDDLSSLSDIDSEVLEPSVQVCSSADLHILKESNDETKHPTVPSKVFHQGDNDVKTTMDICNGTNTASVKSPNKSSTFSDAARNSTWSQSSGTNNFFDVDWTGGVSFTGWLPAIPESSFEGEEDGEVYKESKESDEKSHQGIQNVDKKVIERENMADSSKGEPSDSNMIVGVSFTGWLPAIPETSFEGDEDGEVYEESKENNEKSHQGIENVGKFVIERENMADSSKVEPSDSNMIVDGSRTDPSKTTVHLPNEGNICELTLHSKTGSASSSDEDYKSPQIEINHNDEENGCREAIQIDNGSRIYIETQNLCGNSLLPSVCEKHCSKEEVQEEIQTTRLNLEGANGERRYTSPSQSGQKPQFSNDDSLRYFELGVAFDIDVDVDTAIKKHPRYSYNHEEIETMELVDSPASLSEGIEVMELEDSPTSFSEEIEIVKQECSPISLSMSLGMTDPPLSQPKESSASNLDDACNVDVYVKWGKPTEKLDKLICIVSLPKTATLAELRKEITPHVAHANKQFTFLMLGESNGGEVDQETESELRVGSLPDCLDRKGCHLACLRPPRRIKHSLPPDRLSNPLVQIENKIPNSIQTVDKKKGSNSKSANAPTGPSLNKGGLRTLPGKKDRSKVTFKDKAKALNFQDHACTLLHGV